MKFLKTVFFDWWESLSEPRLFFGTTLTHRDTTQAITFALLVSWFSALVEWSVRVVKNETLLDGFLKIRDQMQTLPAWKGIAPLFIHSPGSGAMSGMPAWAMELFAVLGNPFATLISLVTSTLMIWFGAWLLIGKVDFSKVLKVLAFASTGSKLISAFLSFLPMGLGYLVGGIWGFVIQILAISSFFQVSAGRAFGVIILPGLIMGLIMTCFLGLVAGVLGALLGSLF